MNHKLLSLLLKLYPRAWRNRYSDEVRHLVAELEVSGKRPVSILADLVIGGVTERTRPRSVRLTALVAGSACAVAITLVSLGSAGIGRHAGAGTKLAARVDLGSRSRMLCRAATGTRTAVIMNPDSGVIITRTRCGTA